MFRLMPFIGIVMAIYAAFALLGAVFGDADFDMATFLGNEVWRITLPSKKEWPLNIGELFILAGLVALGIESLKAAGTTRTSMGNHILSMLSFIAGLLLFILVAGFETSPFFLLVAMAGIDTMAGMLVSIVTARRDFGVERPDM